MRPHFSTPEAELAPPPKHRRSLLLFLLLVSVGLWGLPRLIERFEGSSLVDYLGGVPVVGALLGADPQSPKSQDAMARIQHLLNQQEAAQSLSPPEEEEEPLVLMGAAKDLTPEEREELLREAERNRPRATRGSKVGPPARSTKVVK